MFRKGDLHETERGVVSDHGVNLHVFSDHGHKKVQVVFLQEISPALKATGQDENGIAAILRKGYRMLVFVDSCGSGVFCLQIHVKAFHAEAILSRDKLKKTQQFGGLLQDATLVIAGYLRSASVFEGHQRNGGQAA